ncbi:uncharacterized protein Z518_03970 [Rhinocladiella mackenziei CBS 650.93]|uniref:Rhinocladiella mackenziei CBS 650.93 unplaced genomic scaffold supercont1.3, whole genome shotgun sequence n=1 Tax=Rhinocladiella mackenziei CBS 650.93 TaxID=1442369 RepID=A0A0D2ISB2_9EURO|nr:uncharacterized protein Z518_03970 [Rhinocladiella mackenziei CBS 650.93]KIX05996.1 hypothetical protein Z518_03970 [Rhinocladiella mackenziei CBS 650.93]
MDDPVAEIPHIIETLCTAPPEVQRAAIVTYFTPTASFTHPFCRTGSFAGSVWLVIMIYRWYKILSPHIDVAVDSIAFDRGNLLLYVSIHQNFKLRMVPLYSAPVKLVTVLQLTTDPISHAQEITEVPTTPSVSGQENGKAEEKVGRKKVNFSSEDSESNKSGPSENSSGPVSKDTGDEEKYYIQSQNDLYQTSEFIKFVVPWGIGVLFVVLWQFFVTILCVLGTKSYDILMWLPHKLSGSHFEVLDNHNKDELGAD